MENVVIIGGGPAGLAAALYTARAGLSPLVLAGSPPGGQLILTSEIENYLGFESILGAELIEKFRNHAKKFGARIIDENVIKVDFSKKPFEVYLAGPAAALLPVNAPPAELGLRVAVAPPARATRHLSKSVIIATGAKALWLGLESEKRLRGKGVSACATCDGFFFKNKKVAVIGGGDTALEEALTLTRFAEKVYIIHRRAEFNASKIMQKKVFENKKIEVIWNENVEEILGEKKVERVKLKNKTLQLEGVFIAIGHRPDTELFKDQIELDEKGYILTFNRLAEDYLRGRVEISEEKMNKIKTADGLYSFHTSVRGVFAAGDCVDYLYRQASYAMGMGVGAALEAERWLSGQNTTS